MEKTGIKKMKIIVCDCTKRKLDQAGIFQTPLNVNVLKIITLGILPFLVDDAPYLNQFLVVRNLFLIINVTNLVVLKFVKTV